MGTALEKSIWIPKGKEYQAYEIHNIYYCESHNQYTLFYVNDGSKALTPVISSKGIGEWEKELDGCGFCRIHSQTLVNIKHIKRFINSKDGVVVLTNDISLSVSKSKKQKFMEDLGIK
jgi:two-component system LytT family response regulator